MPYSYLLYATLYPYMFRMHYLKSLLFVFILIAGPVNTAESQEIIGLWEITKVAMGDQQMTPVAKWTRINPDSTYDSGNGWLKNSEGSWTYDRESNEFMPLADNGLEDEYGPFTISFKDGDMLWKRIEDGMEVTVTLSPIEELPKSTADKLNGSWDLTTARKNSEDITAQYDPEDQYNIFLRWDRIYVEHSVQGENYSGYWHIDAHRPEITFISHDSAREITRWKVDVTDQNLEMSGISDSNRGLILSFKRIYTVPE